jgi:predicted phage terminase large subunit-like protein
MRMRSTSNPGGVGHEWVKARFVDPQPDGADPGRGFVPAGLADNPHLDAEKYRASLAELDPVTRAQLEHGDWDVRPAGNFFRTATMATVDAADLLRLGRLAPPRCRAWDLAATTTGDWSVGVLLAWLPFDRTWLVEDVVRVRQEPGELERTLRATAERDGRNTLIVVEQEGGSSGKMAMRDIRTRILAGFPVRPVNPSGSKQARAMLPASHMSEGDVRMARAPWNAEFVAELSAFPNAGMHDDQVDALSYAFHALAPQARATDRPVSVVARGSITDWATRPRVLPPPFQQPRPSATRIIQGELASRQRRALESASRAWLHREPQ